MFFPKKAKGNQIQSDVKGVSIMNGQIACLSIPGAKAVALSANGCHASMALSASTQNITTGITNPLTPRNVSIVGGAAGQNGVVTITGTNYKDEVITESITSNGTTTVQGAKAFKTITNIALPVQNAGGDTIQVGFGNNLGLPFYLPYNTCLNAYLNKVKEGTAPTIATNATAIESNTMLLNSALNGNQVDACFVIQ
ncbi:MAG: hypothetical protein N3B21_19330 [Clostridia bacterium]|nr:hypothetical protein [Clostridia bacterium]